MDWIWTALGVAFVLSAITLLIAYVCYRLAFHVTPDQKTCKEEYPIPPGEIYEPFREVMTKWIQQTRKARWTPALVLAQAIALVPAPEYAQEAVPAIVPVPVVDPCLV